MRDYTSIADHYAADVLANIIPACEYIKLACVRYQRDRADTEWRYVYDPAKANRVCSFIEKLPHTKGKWAAANELLILQPWQVWLTSYLFGFVHKATGLRRFRIAMVLVPRKNGKSIWAAAVCLYVLAADQPRDMGIEVYTGAQSEKQAWEIFRPGRLMAQRTPALCAHFGIQVNASNLHIAATGSKFEPVIGSPGDGTSPSLAVLDEFHESDAPELRNTMLTGMGARQQPLLLMVTTAGANLAGPCWDDVLTGRGVLRGTIPDEERFYVEWTIDVTDDWTSPSALEKANPNLGISVSKDFLISAQQTAIRNPREQGPFRTKHLNEWVTSKSVFFNMASWQKSYDPDLTLDHMDGRRCYVGMDLASKQDIAAMVLLFPPDGDEHWHVFGNFYLPEDVVNEPGKDHYKGWALSGKLITTDGNMIDHLRIADDLEQFRKRFDVEEVCFDPAQANMFMTDLMQKGVTVIQFVQYAKNFTEPMKLCAALIDGCKIKHNSAPNDPMSWQMSNVVAMPDAKEQVYPRKERPENKIDGPVAMIIAMARAMLGGTKRSIYEDRGFQSFG
jgi:phage terminase large subunit-like protein